MASIVQHGAPSDLLPTHFSTDITRWLAEDTPSFDYGGFVVGSEVRNAFLLCKSVGVLAGVPFFDEVFRQCGCAVIWHHSEGTHLNPWEDAKWTKIKVATVTGPTRMLLLGERVALNMLARCSGVATKSRMMLSLVRKAGYEGIIAGTRKTTPGFRLVEKYGMLIGGIDGHRHDLSSMIMLKDNHIWAKGACTLPLVRNEVSADIPKGPSQERCKQPAPSEASPSRSRWSANPKLRRTRPSKAERTLSCWTTLTRRACERRPRASSSAGRGNERFCSSAAVG